MLRSGKSLHQRQAGAVAAAGSVRGHATAGGGRARCREGDGPRDRCRSRGPGRSFAAQGEFTEAWLRISCVRAASDLPLSCTAASVLHEPGLISARCSSCLRVSRNKLDRLRRAVIHRFSTRVTPSNFPAAQRRGGGGPGGAGSGGRPGALVPRRLRVPRGPRSLDHHRHGGTR